MNRLSSLLRLRYAFALIALTVGAVYAWGATVASSTSSRETAAGDGASAASAGSRTPATKPRRSPFWLAPGESVVAHAKTPLIKVFDRRGAARPRLVLRNPTAKGVVLVFLVKTTSRYWVWPKWVRVYLPMRPNGVTGWIRSRGVTFYRDPYRIKVELRRHRITVWKLNRIVMQAPVGVGRPETPTPVGRFYIVEKLRQLNPHGMYGPYAFGISAFSNVLEQFGGGPGQIGLHGTNYADGLGRDVSRG